MRLGLSDSEKRWVSEEFLTRLNERMRRGAELSGAHYIDVSDAFRGHPICSATSEPWAHGLTWGDDLGIIEGVGPIGNESFHPTQRGQDRLATVAWEQHGPASLAVFGDHPNPEPGPLTQFDNPDAIEILSHR